MLPLLAEGIGCEKLCQIKLNLVLFFWRSNALKLEMDTIEMTDPRADSHPAVFYMNGGKQLFHVYWTSTKLCLTSRNTSNGQKTRIIAYDASTGGQMPHDGIFPNAMYWLSLEYLMVLGVPDLEADRQDDLQCMIFSLSSNEERSQPDDMIPHRSVIGAIGDSR